MVRYLTFLPVPVGAKWNDRGDPWAAPIRIYLRSINYSAFAMVQYSRASMGPKNGEVLKPWIFAL